MIRKMNLRGRLLLATIVASGVVASPVATSTAFMPQLNAANAQENAQNQDTGGGADSGATGQTTDEDGNAVQRAEERTTPSPHNQATVYELLGTTPEEAEQARPDVAITGTTSAGPLRYYQEAIMNNRLDAAAEILAAVSNVPISESLVTQVNDVLGLQTTLTAAQIADAAASQQDIDADVVVVITEAEADNVYDLLGTTREEAEQAQADAAITGTTSAGPLRYYQEAVMNDRLDAAAEILASISNVPITESVVVEVNDMLGLETRLTASQLADAAARKQ